MVAQYRMAVLGHDPPPNQTGQPPLEGLVGAFTKSDGRASPPVGLLSSSGLWYMVSGGRVPGQQLSIIESSFLSFF